MRPTLVPLSALLVLLLTSVSAARSAGDLEKDVASLLELRDVAPAELIDSIAGSGEARGLEGLCEAFQRMGSLGMRVRIIEATQAFADDRPDQLVPWLTEIAKTPGPGVVADAALDAVAACGKLGRTTLREIAEGDLPDSVREGALQRHIDGAEAGDTLWYLQTWQPREPSRGSRKRGEPAPKTPPTARMRRFAFDAVLPGLGDPDLSTAVRSERDREIRQRALLALHERNAETVADLAREVFGSATEQSQNRAVAAEILWERLGVEVSDELLAVGTDNVAPLFLRYRIADFLRTSVDSKVERSLVKLLRKGREYQQLFALRALSSTDNPKTVKEIVRLLRSKRPNVVLMAVDALRSRRETGALDDLAELVDKGKDATISSAAAGAWTILQEDAEVRRAQLETWTQHAAYQVRAAAYTRLGAESDSGALELLEAGLGEEQWSCQYAALRALEERRTIASVGVLIDRMQTAEGRLLHELSEACWRLTGQTFGEHPKTWSKWFLAESDALRILDVDEQAGLEEERKRRLLAEQTISGSGERRRASEEPSEFFGVRIRTNRVVFVLDVSGSMERTLKDVYEGERGLERFGVATTELKRCLAVLEPSTQFTVVTFSAYLKLFEPELVKATEDTISSANRFIDDLDLAGGTDVWEALERALAIDGVDTIYLLSDGEPEGGAITDPVHIRMAFRRRNTDRSAVVHSIALGDELPLLRWLAEDTGGSYTRFR